MRQNLSFLARAASVFPMLSLLLFPVGPVLAVGASPSEIFIPSLLRGVPQTASVVLMRGQDPQGDLSFRVGSSGEGAQYLKFEPTAVIPAGEKWIDFPFQVDPGLAQTGDYEAKLEFVSGSPQTGDGSGSGGMMSIITGVNVKVHFTVSGEELVAFDLISASVSDTESSLHPFVAYSFSNKGNVNWRPERADLAFTDSADATHVVLATLESAAFSDVPPGITKQEQIEVPVSLPEGTYVLTSKIYDKEGVVGELVAQEFDVLAPGTMLQTGKLESVTTKTKAVDLGNKVLLEAAFRNTGTVPIVATLMTEVFKGDAYLDLVRGEDVTVDAGTEASFSQVVELSEPGDYTLSSHVRFGNKKTAKQDVSVTVVGKESLLFFNTPTGIGLISLGILSLAAGFVVVRRMRSRSTCKQAAAPSESPVVPAAAKPAEDASPTQPPTDSAQRW